MHNLNDILTELIFILLHLFVFSINYHLASRKLFHPAVLFSLVWTLILFLHFIFELTILDQLFALRLETYLTLFVGTICFSIGDFLLTNHLEKGQCKKRQELVNDTNSKVGTSLRIIFLGIIAVGLPFYIIASYRVFLASNIDNFFVGLRTELSYGDEDIGITKYLTSLSFVIFAINYYALLKDNRKLNRYLAIVSFALALIYSIFATGRTYYFIILSVYLGIGYLLKQRISVLKFLFPLFIFLLLFMGLGIIYNKGGNKEDTLKENIHSSLETTGVYMVSSLNAFDIELKNNIKAKYAGENTLLFFVKGLQKFNLLPHTKTGTLLSEFVFVPYPTNVYTFYSPYIRDWGKLYSWLMIFLFGSLHSWLFFKAQKTQNLRYVLYYSFSLYPLLMSFFQDQYMSLFSTWLQIIFYTELFIAITNFFAVRGKGEKSDAASNPIANI